MAAGEDKKIILPKIEKLFGDSELGGLRVGSLRAKNLSLLHKWKWKWLTETGSLWMKIVASINSGDPGSAQFGRRADKWSVWLYICKASGEVESLRPGFSNSFSK